MTTGRDTVDEARHGSQPVGVSLGEGLAHAEGEMSEQDMKRYEQFCSYDGGGPAVAEEAAAGDWVRYEDALAAVAAERERCAKLIEPKNAPSDWTPLAQYAADLARRIRTES